MNRGHRRKRGQKSDDSRPRAGRIAHKTVHSCWRHNSRSRAGEAVAPCAYARRNGARVAPTPPTRRLRRARCGTGRPFETKVEDLRGESTLNALTQHPSLNLRSEE